MKRMNTKAVKKGKMRDSRRLRFFLEKIESSYSHSRLQKLKDELVTMHDGKFSRTMRSTDIINRGQKQLIEAANQSSAYRSRMARILSELQIEANDIDHHMDKLKKFLVMRYAGELRKRQITTKDEREGYVEGLMQPAADKLHEINNVIGIAEMFIEDIDKFSYYLRALVDTLELNAKRETRV